MNISEIAFTTQKTEVTISHFVTNGTKAKTLNMMLINSHKSVIEKLQLVVMTKHFFTVIILMLIVKKFNNNRLQSN